MIKRFSRSITIAAYAVLFSACHKLPNAPKPTTSNVDVYMIESKYAHSALLKNGVVTDLGTMVPTDFVLSGSDIYICGDFVSNDKYSIQYWKNGVLTNITDGTTYAEADCIFVNGSDVYIGGELAHTATYWKNGKPVVLTTSGESGTITGIAVVGNDVYAIGTHGIPNISLTTCYWKNGQRTDLASQSIYNIPPAAIAVSGNDIYMAWMKIDDNDNAQTSYSKNFGTPVLVTDDSYGGTFHSLSLTIVGSDVYIAGPAVQNNNMVAAYWKNGKPVYVSNDSKGAFATSMAVSGNDIYVSGWTQTVAAGKAPTACYWKNGTETLLDDGSLQTAIEKIIVMPK